MNVACGGGGGGGVGGVGGVGGASIAEGETLRLRIDRPLTAV